MSADELSPLKRAFLALEDAQARLAAVESAAREPIAIIGMGCRVPGADSPAAFWELLRNGVDAVGPVPGGRFDLESIYQPGSDAPGRTTTREAGFVRDVDQFDAEFFGIAPREAQGMDPQQGLLLEVSWEALEHAAQAPDRLEGSATGVYFGVCSTDYANLQAKADDPHLLDAHYTSGIAHSVASGRLSYILGLEGPSLTIDTACSSSLVAVHLASQALRTHECRMALAGGVNLMLSPDLFVAFSHSRMLAADGRCKTFDAAADGFGRGEGCGVVVLKRLSDAIADGDRVLAVIRGSAVNQDGPSSGLTAPNGPAQEAVIREALSRAGLTPNDIGYIEAHGTGTELGDPLEVRALGEVFGPSRASAPRLLLGSVKTNLGHLEAAAGVTGLIKVVLALRHRAIPAHLHFQNPSPHIRWADLPFTVPTALTPWEPIGGQRIAGVSSFGFSGTNAHVVVGEGPVEPVPVAAGAQPQLCAISARDDASLAALASTIATSLDGNGTASLADVSYTLSTGRAQFPARATIMARTIAELREGLLSVARGETREGVRRAHAPRGDPRRIAFLFTGQGAQYPGMGAGLYRTAPVFRAALDECAERLRPYLERPLLGVLFGEPGTTPLEETAYTQPALFALEYALAQLLRSWNVQPAMVMGHSVGEYVAACVAGVMSLDDGLRLIAERGRLMQSLPPGGAMTAIFASEDSVLSVIDGDAAAVSVAAVNGPGQTVISGSREAVDRVAARFAAKGVRCKPLPVSHAFHSPLVEPILDAFERTVAGVKLSAPRLRMVSNVTGAPISASDATSPKYWRRHVREPVRFAAGLEALAGLKPDICIEVGPHPTLVSFAETTFANGQPPVFATLRKGRPDLEHTWELLSSLYMLGVDIDWRGVHRDGGGRPVDLPTYPFQRSRHWFTAQPRERTARGRPTGHPLLGTRLRSAGSEIVYEAVIRPSQPAYVGEHRVQGRVVMPATGYLELLGAAARDRFGEGDAVVADVAVEEAMVFDDADAPRIVQVVCGQAPEGGLTAAVHSVSSDTPESEPWTRHVTARLKRGDGGRDGGRPEPLLDTLRARCPQNVDVRELYAGLERRGIDFGPGFHTVSRLSRGHGEALGDVELAPGYDADVPRYLIHPLLLDGCLQVVAAAMPPDDDALFLPVAFSEVRVIGSPGASCVCHAKVDVSGGDVARAELSVFDANGTAVASVGGVRLQRVSRDAIQRLGDRWLDEALYSIDWVRQPRSETVTTSVSDLARTGAHAFAGLRRSAGLDAYDEFFPKFEALCADYTVAALHALGWNPPAGERFEAEALATRLGVAARHRKLFARLLEILGEAGVLDRRGDAWITKRTLPAVKPAATAADLASAYPMAAAEMELTARVAGEMAPALRGERDPLQLLFPGGSLDIAERLYRDAPTAKVFNGLVAEVVQALAQGRPSGRPVRILEVGGGTGGTTAHVAPRLGESSVEYTFTDVGPLFVARARERFSQFSFIDCAVLDLERDPETQGFTPGTFDVILASNVIHATADLRRTLGRVRRLLAPGGVLAMLEVTSPQRWFDLTVGLTEGWWAFTDRDLRPSYATLSENRWRSLLMECGFDEVAALPGADAGGSGSAARQSLLLARAPTSVSGHAHWVVFADRAGTGDALAAALRARGDRCTTVHHGPKLCVEGECIVIDSSSATDYARALAAAAEHEPFDGVIQCWPLDAPPAEAAALDVAALAPSSVLRAAQALIAMAEPARYVVVTRGAQQADAIDDPLAPVQTAAWGIARGVAIEHPELRCVAVDLDPRGDAADVAGLVAALDHPSDEPQVAVRGGERRVARLHRIRRPAPPTSSSPVRLTATSAHSLDALVLEPIVRRAPREGEVEIAVEATGLNFKDVLNVLGMYPGDPGPLGGECAGTVTAVGAGVTHLRPGDAVLALAGGSFASHVVARAEWVRLRPAGQSAEEGAAFPIAYVTAEFCLGHLARMRAGERVLIHAAAGGVGMAAVRLAQRAGAEVYATAGSEWKRELLRSIGVEHVFDSRNGRFADEILERTHGAGVDIVLNSLSDGLIDASFRSLATGGRFVEIGKRGIKTAEEVARMGRDLRYFIVDWGRTGEQEPELIGQMLTRLTDELARGLIPPLPRRVFAMDEVSRAFRCMAQARHAGKIVVRHSPTAPVAVQRNGTYLITGGLSGLGPVLARWLAERGAGRLVLVSRRGITSESAPTVDALRAAGTTVLTEAVDVTDRDAMDALLKRIRASGPPIRGVVHGAGVLDDASLVQQTPEKLERVMAPKVIGALVLDRLTRADPLDWFVLFSSAASVLGSAGQANHSAANAFLDVFARSRRANGAPALSINWGAWSDVGAAAARGVAAKLAARGLQPVTPQQGLRALELAMSIDAAQLAVLPADWQRYLAEAGNGPAVRLLEDLPAAPVRKTAGTPGAERRSSLRADLDGAPAARRHALVAAFVRDRALRALGVDPTRNVDPRMPLGEMGLDSLLAVELRNTIGSEVGKTLPASLLFDFPTIETLTGYLLSDVLGFREEAPAPAAAPVNVVSAIEDLSDEEVERRLLARSGAKRP
ncbi:MAG: SDR family NAD(P)-dependent oxidoreductase [Gemmatimonadales bacterium]